MATIYDEMDTMYDNGLFKIKYYSPDPHVNLYILIDDNDDMLCEIKWDTHESNEGILSVSQPSKEA